MEYHMEISSRRRLNEQYNESIDWIELLLT